jgi:serine/threonine protein kinase
MDLTGRILGRYRLVGRVARGGMADVYKAHQESLDRIVALKILPSTLGQDETFQARFEQEARAIARLHHPNILTVYDYGQEDGLTYIVMEYTSGGTLRDRMRRPLSLGEAVQIARQIGHALDYAHRHGVVHRDVKPSNVLLTEEGWPLLSDFGLVKIAQESKGITRPSASMGTPDYMSPEQGQGLPVDHRTDIYALGALLYELVTGQIPYTAESPVGLILKHATEPLPSPRLRCPDLPPGIESVIVKAMAKAPEDRYASAGEMVEALGSAWSEAQGALPALSHGSRRGRRSAVRGARPRTPSHKRRRRTIWAAILATLAIAGGVMAAWTLASWLVAHGLSLVAPRALSPMRNPGTTRPTGSTRTSGTMGMALATPTFTSLPRPTPTLPPAARATAMPTTIPTAHQNASALVASATPTTLPSSTPAATATSTPTPQRAVARLYSSLFEGPSAQTEELDIIAPGQSVEIGGRSDEWQYGRWLYVRIEEGSEGFVDEPRFVYTATWASLPVVEIDRSELILVSTPVSSRTVRLAVTPGPLQIEYVWPSSICHADGNWTALFLVKISGGDGQNYTFYWDEEPIPYTVKVEERDVAVIERPGSIGRLVGTVWVESGGKRVGQATSVRKSCSNG